MLLLDDLSIMNIAKCLNLLYDTFIRKQVIEKGFINAQRFSWEKTYKETMDLYKYAWNNKKV